jgi:HAD superfamily hydrolase (TIGR01549 family)
LPKFEFEGREIHTTLPWLLEHLRELVGGQIDPAHFVRTYWTVTQEVSLERDREGIEITCFERFRRTLERVALGDGHDLLAIANRLARRHMAGVRSVTTAPRERVDAVKRLAGRYRLGLISNFDDSQTGHEIMHDTGVRDLFEAVIISADVGLRKPNPLIFERMLNMLRLDPAQILFVGDLAHHDVAGAKRVGMRAAWINKNAEPLPANVPDPDLVIADLAELPEVLGC